MTANAKISASTSFREAPLRSHFRIDEALGPTAESQFTWIGVAEERLAIWKDGLEALPLEPEYIRGVFERYANPIDECGQFTARLDLPDGSQLLHMLFVPRFDVVPKDYLVWLPADGAPLVALCAQVAPPLYHLAQARAQALHRA